jgi:endonuclease/exonuclease/phosphatase family metal-dependent hydrolase
LSKAWTQYAFWGVGRDDGARRGEYAGIFYNKAIFQYKEGGHFWLSHSPEKPGTSFPGAGNTRMVSWVRLWDAAEDMHSLIVNTHWDHVGEEARLLSAQLMVDRIKTLLRPGEKLIILGDFNSFADSVEFSSLKAGVDLQDAYRLAIPEESPEEATYHGYSGETRGRRIDFILVPSSFSLISADIIRDSFTSRFPSDHYPVQAHVCLGNG